ncbi:MAG: hypothetical protein VZR64_10405 [Eubacterium sp.]|nr:hypothetical protein [Eubacterium sp.]
MLKFILALPSAIVVFFGIIFSYIKDFIKGEKQENGEDYRIFLLFLLGLGFIAIILWPIMIIPNGAKKIFSFVKKK